MEGILQHLGRYLETPWGVTNLRLEVISLNKDDCYTGLDILGELQNVYTSTLSKSSSFYFALPNSISQNKVFSLWFCMYANHFFYKYLRICICYVLYRVIELQNYTRNRGPKSIITAESYGT